MPSGPDHWHTHWEDDRKAIDYLLGRDFHFLVDGRIGKPTLDFEPDNLDYAAIEYLVAEWDYAYDPNV
jgi:hypothetical protein